MNSAIWVSDPEFNRFDPEAGTYETHSIAGFAISKRDPTVFNIHTWAGTDRNEIFFDSREAREIAAAITKATEQNGV